MKKGLLAGILWALDTVLLGHALAGTAGPSAVLLAPLASTFLHDLFSSLYQTVYRLLTGQLGKTKEVLFGKEGKWIVLASLIGAPVGMTAYTAAISFMGASYTAIVSSVFPALGAWFAHLILKEKMTPLQIAGLLLSIGAVTVMGLSTQSETVRNLPLGLACGLVCCIGWALETVVHTGGLKNPSVDSASVVHIRQSVSALFYLAVILPAVKGFRFAGELLCSPAAVWIALSALCGVVSLIWYYHAAREIGASKAMALDITYSAWAVLFNWAFYGTLPDARAVICGILIMIGSLTAAADWKEIFGKRKEGTGNV